MKYTLALMVLLSSIDAHAFGGGRPVEIPGESLTKSIVPAGKDLIDVGSFWATLTRKVHAFALVEKTKRIYSPTESTTKTIHFVDFMPFPRMDEKIYVAPFQARIALDSFGRPLVRFKKGSILRYPSLVFVMDIGIFGKQRQDLEKLAFDHQIEIGVPRFEGRGMETISRFVYGRSEGFPKFSMNRIDVYYSYDREAETPLPENEKWIIRPQLVVEVSASRKELRKIRRALRKGKSIADVSSEYEFIQASRSNPAASPVGPEARVEVFENWIPESIQGSIACVELPRFKNQKPEITKKGKCAGYWAD